MGNQQSQKKPVDKRSEVPGNVIVQGWHLAWVIIFALLFIALIMWFFRWLFGIKIFGY